MSGSDKLEPGRVIPLSGGFEYHLISLNSPDGMVAVEEKLNAWSAQGWRLLPMTVSHGQFGIMERARA